MIEESNLPIPEPFSSLIPSEAIGNLLLIYGFPTSSALKALLARGHRVVVTGISNEAKRQLAGETAGFGGDISFADVDIERRSPTTRFDYVFCLVGSTCFRNPLAVLERLIEVARKGLSFAVSKPLSANLWSLDPSSLAYPVLKRLPGVFLLPSSRKKTMDQAFAVTIPMFQAFFKSMRQDFSNVGYLDRVGYDEIVVLARKRQIGTLHILAGVNAVGKSTMLDNLRSGGNAELAKELGLDPTKRWVFTTYAHLLKNSEITDLPNLVVQYNITAPAVHGSMHGHHHGLLDLINCAEVVDITTMWLPHDQQKARYFQDRVPKGTFSSELHERRASAKLRDVQGPVPGAAVRSNIFYFRSEIYAKESREIACHIRRSQALRKHVRRVV